MGRERRSGEGSALSKSGCALGLVGGLLGCVASYWAVGETTGVPGSVGPDQSLLVGLLLYGVIGFAPWVGLIAGLVLGSRLDGILKR